MSDVVRRYLSAVATCDWATAEACVAEGVVRIGPFGDTYVGRGPYLTFLAELMPTLSDYAMDVHRIVGSDSIVTAELAETMTFGGEPSTTEECLVFDLDDDGHIARLAIYLRQ
jgi:hypothetical protein